MKNIIRLTIVFIALYSCNSTAQRKNALELEIISKSVYYVPIDTINLMHNKVAYTNEERSKACNELIYIVRNNTDKKYFFALKTNELGYYGSTLDFNSRSNKDMFLESVTCLIDNKTTGKNIRFVQHDNLNSLDDSLRIYSSKKASHSLKLRNYRYKDYYEEFFANNTFVLHPGEYKIIKTTICLPLITDKDSDPDFFSTALLLSPSLSYKFSLAISIDKESIRKELPDYLIKEINDNGYEIFGGKLISNSIPIVVRP